MDDRRRRRVLVVEDEVLVAMMIEDTLQELGYDVVGPAYRLGAGLTALDGEPVDLAVLDVNLAGERSIPIADRLAERGIPFVFATGYGKAGLMGAHPDAPVLRKPFSGEDIRVALARLLERQPQD
ncbi:response regulator [Salinarimonas rosea]|uniref:response regulator n=1 Tax=Salinarimonas rosea TaxID=552063 RepID=UPI000426DBFB|nr:response regulator [Salinarimonas rosea]